MPPKTRSKQATPEITVSSSTSALDPSIAGTGEKGLRPREGSRTRHDEVVDPDYALGLANRPKENIYLFVPNIIGYIRVITAAVSLALMPKSPKLCTLVYFISCILDVFDGMAARALNQTSKFGAVLDMVTDRCATACLLCFLSSKYPQQYSLLFMFLITLDFSSHYIHMYSSLLTGSSSHKTVTAETSRILWLYYNNKYVLFAFCFFNEVCFVCAYLAAFEKTPIHSSIAIKALCQVFPLARSVYSLPILGTIFELWGDLTWAQFVGGLAFPWCFGKQIINVVQFWKASKILVGVDLAERQAARESAAQGNRGR